MMTGLVLLLLLLLLGMPPAMSAMHEASGVSTTATKPVTPGTPTSQAATKEPTGSHSPGTPQLPLSNRPRALSECTNSTCGPFCDSLQSIARQSPPASKATLVAILGYCIQQAFSGQRESNCEVFPPFATPNQYCTNGCSNELICGGICRAHNLQDSVPDYCEGVKRLFCRVHFRNAAPNDEISEEFLILGIRDYAEELEVRDIAGGIKRALNSISTRGGMLNDGNAHGILDTLDGVFNRSFQSQWMRRGRGDTEQILQGVDGAAAQIGRDFMNQMRNNTFFHKGENLVFNVERFMPKRPRNSKFHFPTEEVLRNSTVAAQASVHIPYTALCDDEDNCSVVVGVSIVNNFAEYLEESIENSSNASNINDTRYPDAVLLSAYVFESESYSERLEDYPVELYFTPKTSADVADKNVSYHGVFLDTTEFTWSDDGLESELLSNGSVKILSTHLTSFTVLVSINGEQTKSKGEERALNIVTYIGCAISIVSLFLTIVILLSLRKKLKKGVLLYIHLNLSVALLMALIVFVAGIEEAAVNSVLCKVVAVSLQYLFLCVFCWMLSEGIVLYLLVVRVFGNLTKRWYYLLILGWGLPVPVVAISAGILHDQYGTQNYCWIQADASEAAIWTFVIPMILVIVLNAVILVLTVRAIVRGRRLSGVAGNATKYDLAKTAVKGSVVLLPLLGLTWIFGLLAVNSDTTVFAWLFTILNSLQGFFIFFLHVMRNEVVLKTSKTWITKLQLTSNTSRKSSLSKIPDSNRKQHLQAVENPLYRDEEVPQGDYGEPPLSGVESVCKINEPASE